MHRLSACRGRGILVHFDKRSHNPILRQAALARGLTPIPWLHALPVALAFS